MLDAYLYRNFYIFVRCNGVNDISYLSNAQVDFGPRGREEYNDRDSSVEQVLLITQILIGGHK
ncbi:MAG TPA: hypothetical protein PLR07_15305, partial [Promineifilum sp.]|nr:hypothetical protein [Promineifilum sp.]